MAQFTVGIHYYSFGFSGRHVADIDVEAENVLEALELAYARTQNIESSWIINPGVRLTEWGREHAESNATAGRDPGMRSSSVGDEFVCEQAYVVAPVGFKPKTPEVLADPGIAMYRESRERK